MSLFPSRIYLDYAASTPVIAAAARAYTHAARLFGNPSAIHAEGQEAQRALTDARTSIARSMNVKSHEILFTSGGTEANNLAILGLASALNRAGISYEKMHIITSVIEHPSVLECVREFEHRGGSATYVTVTKDGLVDLEQIKKSLRPETILVSIQHVNSEIGTVQPLREISQIVRSHNGFDTPFQNVPGYDGPYVHSDASQSPRYLDCSPERLGADMVTIDAQKIGGHKGIGTMVLGRFVPVVSVLFGGSQESGKRPGTESVALGASFAAALADAVRRRTTERLRLEKLQEYFFTQAQKEIPGVLINGSLKKRIANNVNISLPGHDAEYLAVWLDQHGVACSTKSACLGAEGEGSHVIRALSNDEHRAKSALRFSFGPDTTKRSIDRVINLLRQAPTFT